MRAGILVVLIFLLASIMTPITIDIPSYRAGKSLFSLDICHISASNLSANMPYICEYPYRVIILEYAESYRVFSPVFNLFMVSYQMDHPPKV